jgi:hypothetical protein
MAIEEGESSSKVVILKTKVVILKTKVVILKTKAVIKKAKDKDRDIKITINNNILLKRPIKVILLLKFNNDPSKLKEYLNKV